MPPTTLNSEEPQIHAPIDLRALALMREQNAPTMDAPPRTALWGFMMELLAK